MKVKFHPLFFLLAGFFAVLGRFELLCGYLIGVVAHEIAHNRMAKLRGYSAGVITVMPYGGVVDCKEEYSDSDNILIALAAPFFNIAFSTFVVAAWWVIPEVYNYTQDICLASLALGLVNLLPFYPLDGSRVVVSFAKNKIRAVKIIRIITIAAGTLISVAGVAVAIVTLNVTLPVFGMFLLFGGVVKGGGESYYHITKNTPFTKDYSGGLIEKTIYVSADTSLVRLLSYVGKNTACYFIIVDEQGEEIDSISEKTLGKLCVANELSVPVISALQTLRKQQKTDD